MGIKIILSHSKLLLAAVKAALVPTGNDIQRTDASVTLTSESKGVRNDHSYERLFER